jgi:hypothetical protein
MDPALNNVVRSDICNRCTQEFRKLRAFGDLMLNYRLNIFLFLLSIVLPLNISSWTTAEVVGSVLFRDNVSTPGPGTTDLCRKTSNFCLDLCSLDPKSSGFQLLSLLL